MGRLTFVTLLVVTTAASAEPTLRVLAEPEQLLLGPEAKRAKIVIEGADGEVQLFANVGEVSQPRPSERGLVAEFLPPSEFFPQVAIIAARVTKGNESRWAWTVIRLAGRGVVEVDATAYANVVLKLAGRRFGPVRANRRGKALVPIEVPPGYETARAGAREVPVGAPPFLRVLAIPDGELPADGVSGGRFVIFAVTPRGGPLVDGKDLKLAVSTGTLGGVEAQGPGHFSVSFKAPALLDEAGVLLRASLASAPEKVQELRAPLVAGRAARLEVGALGKLVAGQIGQLALRAFDAAGNPARLDATQLSPPLTALRRREDGSYTVGVRAPDRVPEGGALRLSASIGELAIEAKLPVQPAPVAAIDVVTPEEVSADPSRPREIEVRARDRFGNPARDATITGVAEHGAVESVDPTDEGNFVLRYQPRPTGERVSERLTVRAGEVEREVSFPLTPYRPRVGLGLHVGALSNFASLTVPTATLDLSYRLEGLGLGLADNLAFSLELGAQYRFLELRVDDGPLAGQVLQSHLTAVPLGLSIRYHLRFLDDFTAYFGVGPDVAYLNSLVLGSATTAEGELGFGGHGHAGITWRVGRGAIVFDLRYLQLFAENLTTVEGAPSGLGLTLGYRVELF